MYKLDDHIACSVAGITGQSILRTSALFRAAHFAAFRAAGRRDVCSYTLWVLGCADLAADANILINSCRLAAQRYYFAYQEPMPVEQLVQTICDTKQVRCLLPQRYEQAHPTAGTASAPASKLGCQPPLPSSTSRCPYNAVAVLVLQLGSGCACANILTTGASVHVLQWCRVRARLCVSAGLHTVRWATAVRCLYPLRRLVSSEAC